MSINILQGDCRKVLKTLPDESVHCCVTSPPYWGLRDYGCDGQIGMEDTPDDYVNALVDVFREVRRVLRKDGTLWLNLGDSFVQHKGHTTGNRKGNEHDQRNVNGVIESNGNRKTVWYDLDPASIGLKPKDMVGIPWLTAFALRKDGWYLRSEIIWNKPNAMPSSATDRPTKTHEQLFLLTKTNKYYYDHEAVKEPIGDSGIKRSLRSVWNINTKGYKGAHFACFPPQLVEPCILAGTSEHGCCYKCGTPYEREVEKVTVDINNEIFMSRTTGWKSVCGCEDSIKPCVVLDPFGGSGTTGEVAKMFGRDCILIELNDEYIELEKERIEKSSIKKDVENNHANEEKNELSWMS